MSTEGTVKTAERVIVSVASILITALLIWMASSIHEMSGDVKVLISRFDALDDRVKNNEDRIHTIELSKLRNLAGVSNETH